ncbi:MAG: hypothetical protein AAGJ29_00680 [Pseudomonadota bacterium]
MAAQPDYQLDMKTVPDPAVSESTFQLQCLEKSVQFLARAVAELAADNAAAAPASLSDFYRIEGPEVARDAQAAIVTLRRLISSQSAT